MHQRKKETLKNEEENVKKAKQLIDKINIFLQNKKKKIYDITNFEISGQIINKFPLIQTVWNYRRDYFEFQQRCIHKKKEKNDVTDTVKKNTSEVTEQRKEKEKEKEKEEKENEKEKEEKEKPKNNIKSENWTIQKLKEQIYSEHVIIKQLLKKFPKSYELWFHKIWLIKFALKNGIMNIDSLLEELEFCKKSFSLDDRNYHCWHYRSYILSCIQMYFNGCLKNDYLENECVKQETTMHELYTINNSHEKENTTVERKVSSFDVFEENYNLSNKLIEKNFSNFSAWFLRYSLTESFINVKEELELIKNAMYTDPYDQSVWQYYNWILFHRGNFKEQIWFTLLNKHNIYFFFPHLIRLDISKCTCYDDNNIKIQGSWEKQIIIFNNKNINEESFVYIFKINEQIKLEKIEHVRFVLYYLKYNIYHPNRVNYERNILQDLFKKEENIFRENKHEYVIHHEIDFKKIYQNKNFQFSIYLNKKNEFTTVNECPKEHVNEYFEFYECINSSKKDWSLGKGIDFNLLQQELKQINELLVLEETCKFALLNKFAILKTLEKYDEAFEVLKLLKKIDNFRVYYYKQEEMELKIKKKIEEYYLHLNEVNDSVLDLSNYHIEDIIYPFFLEAFFIQRINLSNNYLSESSISKCTLNFLYNLKELHLKNNNIKDFSLFMKNIYNLKLLERLDVSDNILMSLEENLEKYELVLLPSLREINISNSNFSILLQGKFLGVQKISTYEVFRKDDLTVLLKQK